MNVRLRHNRLIPELYCSDLPRSLRFYRDVLGFALVYERPEERFAFLDRGGAQLMIEQPVDAARTWLAGDLAQPYGRGISLQIEVPDVSEVHEAVIAYGAEILVPLEDRSYRVGEAMRTSRQFVVLDPDGYLLRFFEDRSGA